MSKQATTTDQADAVWNPPGPGSWICDRSHATKAPTPFYRRIVSEHTEPTYRQGMERSGAAVGSIDMQFVHGALYRRLVPLIAPHLDKGKVPPNPVLWLATRLHPEFRRREKVAAHLLAEKTFLDDIRTWTTSERFEWMAQNAELQAVAVDQLDNVALAAHLRKLDQYLIEGWRRHHDLHISDLGPIGDLLAHALKWDLDTTEIMGLLKGSSPATTDAAKHGTNIAEALQAAGRDPATVTTIDDIRSIPEAAKALDVYLNEFGWRLVSDYDIAGLTLNELPGAVVALVVAAANEDGPGEDPSSSMRQAEARLRSEAPDPDLFDDLLNTAREAYGVRDDNGPLTWAWPAGLLRRSYLEAAGRLVTQGRLAAPDEVFELDVEELALLLTDALHLSTADITARANHRRWEATLESPDVLGPVAPEPDLSPLPPSMRRIMGIVLAAVTMIDPEVTEDGGQELTGLGVGAASYRGIARLADDPVRAIETMQPGDVLVAPWTAPSFNAVLSIAGGVVVQEGGLLCHAAVMARELNIPAVVGCVNAMSQIPDGALVEIDPVSGEVTVLSG